MKKISFLIITVFIFACAGPQPTTRSSLTPEDQAYLDRAMACALTFSIQKDKIDEAWSRANVWVSKYSTTKIQTVNDYIIDTYNPTMASPIHNIFFGPSPTFMVIYSYKVLKTEAPDGFKIDVECFSNMTHYTPAMDQNAHILAHYIKTSELKPHLIYGRK